MYQASVKKILSKSDQENLEKKIENWCQENPQDSFYLDPVPYQPHQQLLKA